MDKFDFTGEFVCLCVFEMGKVPMTRHALVTGSHGFVGRNFIHRLLNDGWKVTAVDSLLPGSGARAVAEWWFDPTTFGSLFVEHIMDARDWFAVNPSEQVDLAIHLAAVVGGRSTIEGNQMAVAEDLAIDAGFWKWAVASKPGHIVSFSSSAAYPINLQTRSGKDALLSETDLDFAKTIGLPDLTYGWAKMTNEFLGLTAASQYGLKVASYRPFSGYGSDQDASYPFRAICERAVAKEVNEEGHFYVWGSGDQKRDFVHISDVVNCVLTTYPNITDGSSINISTGILTSFKELAALACDVAGWAPTIVGLNAKPEGVFARGGDTQLQREKGFTPKVSLREGVALCVESIRKGA
jgi:nucleoside-diphosphate-sugar epimerase